MKTLITFILLFFTLWAVAQKAPSHYASRAHAHNDYEQAFPFWLAWGQGVGSMEADIFLENGQLVVAHDRVQVKRGWTLDSLYLKPLVRCIRQNKGSVYPDPGQSLQLMIDIKTAAVPTLQKLVEVIEQYSEITTCSTLRITISGNRPSTEDWNGYPNWMYFDAGFHTAYSQSAWEKIAMLSDNFANYSTWNGKGRLPEKERDSLQSLIRYAHDKGKKIRFWNAPDILNSWYAYLELGLDFINTDDLHGIGLFFRQKDEREYTNPNPHAIYTPTGKSDGVDKPVRNIILIIGDGTGLPQWYAGYTANRGWLSVFGMKNTGWSKTSSQDNFITDSAPGATAFSSGKKTNNRSVGVDHTGKTLPLITEDLSKKGWRTGVITTGDFRDATPAAFYAHQAERSAYGPILNDLSQSTLNLVAGHAQWNSTDSIDKKLKSRFKVLHHVDQVPDMYKSPILLADTLASKSFLAGRGKWLEGIFDRSIPLLKNEKGFFLMVEGAQVDYGGHANKLPYVVTELLDLDQLIGKALAFADQDGETLVIVTGDHETGGLTLTAGDYERGFISGQFSTTDHTAIPVPVFAYGPRSYLFTGVYENVEIYRMMWEAMNIKK